MSDDAHDDDSADRHDIAVATALRAARTWKQRPATMPSPWANAPASPQDASALAEAKLQKRMRRAGGRAGGRAGANEVPAMGAEQDSAATSAASPTAIPAAAELIARTRAALIEGGMDRDAETLGVAIHEVAMAACVLHAANEARRVIDLVMSGRPLVLRDDGRFHPAPT